MSGIRRCGTSTLLLQSMKTKECNNYVNVEAPRLSVSNIVNHQTFRKNVRKIHVSGTV